MDLPILLITFILLAFGLIMLYSASYVVGIYKFNGDSLHYIKDQVKYAILGTGVMFFASKVDYHILRRYALTLLIIVYALLILALFMPEYNYCHRWITIPGVITFQPSEFAKFAVILLFASMIDRHYDKMKTFTYGVAPFIVILGTIAGLLFLEPHLSAIVITCGVGVIMMFIGGTDIKWFFRGAGIVVVAAIAAAILMPEKVAHVMPRIEAWLNPEADTTDTGYQTYQSILAIGSGGLFGLGLGNGRQKHLHLPEPQNDFIFAVICEELGFVGGMMVIILFIMLFLRGIYIATRAKDKFGAMLAVGIITQIALQAFLNVGVATGTLPNTGISLPFFSEGGTSLVVLMAEMGVVLSVSRYADLNNGD
ncbi:MAG: putative lipid II flippase FtsW [Oscillospiraceae bacterium]|nr:putative lipid II flippase FtsW [Oscillospiraceae bacterium]